MGLWRLTLRVTVGLLFIGHGTQKLFGWFGGEGLDGTGKIMAKTGLAPGREHALAAGLAEAGGGVLLASGAAMPVAASTLTGVMMTAIKRVHLQNGPWVTKGGYEYPLVVIATLLGLVEMGPGKLSVDGLFGSERSGAGWAAMAFGAGAVGAYAVETIADRNLPSPIAWVEDHRPGSHERIAA
ncbi:MAG TPA: DoxX family protein [Gaiellaceae bacterium]|jgi:putative oxidoreductase|nr:DoxX family protein [Gaiellaceae bacterium]